MGRDQSQERCRKEVKKGPTGPFSLALQFQYPVVEYSLGLYHDWRRNMSKQQTLEKWLPTKPRNRKRRAVIYDFDGTIFNSPDREAGELAYLEATGNMFPFPGWWGRIESLMPPVIPEKPGPEWLI